MEYISSDKQFMESKSLETRKYHILIADKDKASIETTIKAFKSENYKFTEITKTKDLVAAVKKEKPDLVILEVDLNEADGRFNFLEILYFVILIILCINRTLQID